MRTLMDGGMLAFDNDNRNMAQSLFNSEGYFWLTTAVASSFAVEELQEQPALEALPTGDEVLALFNRCIRASRIERDEMAQARAWALGNLRCIGSFNDRVLVFHKQESLALSKAFVTYWLFFKLIEVEWQENLAMAETAETYQFLDGVIADGEELDWIEGQLRQKAPLDDDHMIYLRSHWQRVRFFWRNLCNDLVLLAEGLVPYQTVCRKQAVSSGQ